MKPGMKMLMLTKGTEEHDRMERTRYPMTENYDGMESRRRRDSKGRYMRSDWDGDIYWTGDINEPYRKQVESAAYPRPFPMYRNTPDMNMGGDHMNPIGFVADEPEIRHDYGMGSEMEYRTSPRMSGGTTSYAAVPMTMEMAKEWTTGMKNEDGTKGPHWTFEQVKQVMAQKGIDCASPESFWAIMCSLYSDYCSVLKKYGMNKADVYVDLACAWLNDKDAVGGGGAQKAGAYYEHVVKK